MKINREVIHKKYNGCCAYCGCEILLKQMQVDHIVPQSCFVSSIKNVFHVPEFLRHLKEEDLNHIDNLNPACRVCNKWKSSHHLELFRSELQEQIARLHKTSANYRMAFKYGLVQQTHKPILFFFETQI